MLLKRLTCFALFLALGVVMLGAYTRLKDAGLGCPDWPGCYGHLLVPHADQAAKAIEQSFPDFEFDAGKAWAEMVHRYFAGTLGLVILAIAVVGLREWRAGRSSFPTLEVLLLVLVTGQAILGMLTVTMGVFPTIVMAHLVGGFSTLCLLFLMVMVQNYRPATAPSPILVKVGGVAMVVLALQIMLGGWTAANYAARVCPSLPICFSGWQSHLNVSEAFQLWGHGLENYEFATHLDPAAKITIHVAHRIGALIATAVLLLAFALAWRDGNAERRQIAIAGLVLLGLQVSLGVANIVFDLPLLNAVAHNTVAAILMMSLIALVYASWPRGTARGARGHA